MCRTLPGPLILVSDWPDLRTAAVPLDRLGVSERSYVVPLPETIGYIDITVFIEMQYQRYSAPGFLGHSKEIAAARAYNDAAIA